MNGKMKKTLMTGMILMIAGQVLADDEKPLADTGALYVQGALLENTCRMSMDSAWQEIDLGTASQGDLNLVGKATAPIAIKIYLHDCPVMGSWSTNLTPMTFTASTMQPPYRARFVAVADESNPDLVKVTGASGIGLRLRDNHGETVKLSRTGDSILLNPGDDQLTFTLQPERTGAVFTPGPYHAVINFSMIYQ